MLQLFVIPQVLTHALIALWENLIDLLLYISLKSLLYPEDTPYQFTIFWKYPKDLLPVPSLCSLPTACIIW